MDVSVDAYGNSTSGGVGAKVRGLHIISGDVLLITCNPENTWGLSHEGQSLKSNANGLKDHYTQLGDQNFRTGAMLGSFNRGKTYFSVGVFTTIKVLEGGETPELELFCADSDKENNGGTITANVFKLT